MSWTRFKDLHYQDPALGLALDISRIPFPDGYLGSMEPRIQRAFADMAALEKGAIANPSEKRMVGHYWLRAPELAPDEAISKEISSTLASIKDFASKVHSGAVAGPQGRFTHLLVIGIGGSALGPQFVSHALGQPGRDRMEVQFFDNTDPDGMDYVLARLGANLARTLVVVISKSGGTIETRNGSSRPRPRSRPRASPTPGTTSPSPARAPSSTQLAQKEGWLARFPMWDWVGGRTSELCAVGLLPAALQGLDIDAMLAGAAAMDAATRRRVDPREPGRPARPHVVFRDGGRGAKDMVVLPYKDRLLLFSRYLQQLVMESLGKELDLQGRVVNQGIAVYGNKGSTDQHAYVQQLREGVNNFFVTFIEVLQDRDGPRRSRSSRASPAATTSRASSWAPATP